MLSITVVRLEKVFLCFQVSTTIPKLTRRKKKLIIRCCYFVYECCVVCGSNDAHINNSTEDVPVVVQRCRGY
jgi:OOP family OmpA-OmpF porin